MIDKLIRAPTVVLAVLLVPLVLNGCSFRQYAVNNIGNMLAEGDSVYKSDNDIVLVGEALPFSLKFVEMLLAESPEHTGLLTTAARGFTTYAYVYVQFAADLVAADDLAQARVLRARARLLYDRAYHYAVRGLDHYYPGIPQQLRLKPEEAVLRLTGKYADRTIPLIYWSAASLGLAISVSRDDVSMLARIEEVEALLSQAVRLDEEWNEGALHEFWVTFAGAQRHSIDEAQVREHYRQALELSSGTRAGLHLALAEAVSVPNQDIDEFNFLLSKALSIDPDAAPSHRLANLVAQRRARWLMGRTDELFLE